MCHKLMKRSSAKEKKVQTLTCQNEKKITRNLLDTTCSLESQRGVCGLSIPSKLGHSRGLLWVDGRRDGQISVSTNVDIFSFQYVSYYHCLPWHQKKGKSPIAATKTKCSRPPFFAVCNNKSTCRSPDEAQQIMLTKYWTEETKNDTSSTSSSTKRTKNVFAQIGDRFNITDCKKCHIFLGSSSLTVLAYLINSMWLEILHLTCAHI